MMRERRDILLILLSVLITAIGMTGITIAKNWTVLTYIPYLVIIVALVFSIVIVVRGMRIISEQEGKRQKDETKQLIKNSVKETLEGLGLRGRKEHFSVSIIPPNFYV